MRTFLTGAGKSRVRGPRDDRRSVSLLSPPTIRNDEQRFGPGHCPCLGRLTLAHVTQDQQGTWTTSVPKGNSVRHHVNYGPSHRHSKFPAPPGRPAHSGATRVHPNMYATAMARANRASAELPDQSVVTDLSAGCERYRKCRRGPSGKYRRGGRRPAPRPTEATGG